LILLLVGVTQAPVQTRLWQYLLVFVAGQAFFCAHRFYDYLFPGHSNFIVTLLMTLATPLQVPQACCHF
jgi:hypothetical protein